MLEMQSVFPGEDFLRSLADCLFYFFGLFSNHGVEQTRRRGHIFSLYLILLDDVLRTVLGGSAVGLFGPDQPVVLQMGSEELTTWADA